MKQCVLIFLFVCICTSSASTIHRADGTDEELATPLTLHGPRDFEVNGTVVFADPPDGCSPLKNNVSGKIVFVVPNRCYPYEKAKNVEDANGTAVLLSGYRDTFGLLIFYRGPNDGSIDIPVVEVWNALDPPLQEGLNITVSPSPNPMVEFGQGIWIFYSLFLCVFNLCVLVYVVRKFIIFVKRGTKGKAALPYVILSMVIGTCLLRIPILIDPTGWNGIWTWGTIEFFLTLDYSPAVMCALIIAFHWNSELRRVEKGMEGAGFNLSKKKYSYPVNIGYILLIIFELGTSTFRGRLAPAMPFLIGKVIIYFSYSWFVGIYFIWNFTKIHSVMKGGLNNTKNSLGKKAWFAFGAGICLILFGLTVWLVPTPMYDSPYGYFMLRLLTSIELLMSMLFLVMLFEAKMAKDKTTKWANTAESVSVSATGVPLETQNGSSSSSIDSDDVSV